MDNIKDNIMDAVYSEKRMLRKKFIGFSDNALTIQAAKIVSKELKVKLSDILKLYTPSNNLQNDKSWDKNGKIINI